MIIARLLSVMALVVALASASAALGQGVTVYSPVESIAAPAPVVTYETYESAPVYVQPPVVVESAPVTVYRPPATVYRPAPTVTTYSPMVTTYSPVYSPMVTTYSPVVTTPSVVTTPAYVVGRPVVWQPEYVRGQPIRNVLRAVLP